MMTSSWRFERKMDLRGVSGDVVLRHSGDGDGGDDGDWQSRNRQLPPADGAKNWGCSRIPPQSGGGSLLCVPLRGCTADDDGGAGAVLPSRHGWRGHRLGADGEPRCPQLQRPPDRSPRYYYRWAGRIRRSSRRLAPHSFGTCCHSPHSII